MSVTVAIAIPPQANPFVSGNHLGRRPNAAVADKPMTVPIVANASSTPPTFAPSPSINRPRTTAAQDVVIPQVGHRIPNKATSVQGGSPNCWCVPWPLASGSSRQATPSGNRSAMAVIAAKNRSRGVTWRTESAPITTLRLSSPALAWSAQAGLLESVVRKGFTLARFKGRGGE